MSITPLMWTALDTLSKLSAFMPTFPIGWEFYKQEICLYKNSKDLFLWKLLNFSLFIITSLYSIIILGEIFGLVDLNFVPLPNLPVKLLKPSQKCRQRRQRVVVFAVASPIICRRSIFLRHSVVFFWLNPSPTPSLGHLVSAERNQEKNASSFCIRQSYGNMLDRGMRRPSILPPPPSTPCATLHSFLVSLPLISNRSIQSIYSIFLKVCRSSQ